MLYKVPIWHDLCTISEQIDFFPVEMTDLTLNVDISKPNAVIVSQQNTLWAKLAAISQTMANAHTAGFQAVDYSVYTKEVTNLEGKVSFSQTSTIKRKLIDGSFHSTGNPFDVALSGVGNYFLVKASNGNRLTRGGQFQLDKDGFLVTVADNNRVLDSGGGNIQMPIDAKNVRMNSDGNIYADGQFIARLGVFTVADPQKLSSDGKNLLVADESPTAVPADRYHIQQYGYEEANFSPTELSIELIRVMRQYETGEKFIKAYNKALEESLLIKGV